MKKYRVYALVDASYLVDTIEAKNRGDAQEIVDKMNEFPPSLCHQCAGKLDIGDITGFIVEEND